MKFKFASLITLALTCATVIALPRMASAQETYPTQKTADYIGVGATNRGPALDAKLSLTKNLSLRPMAIGNDLSGSNKDVTIYAPLTYDFSQGTGGLKPFIGVGPSVKTEKGGDFGGVVTAGADYPINKRLNATGAVDVGLFGNSEVDGFIGLSTNFNS